MMGNLVYGAEVGVGYEEGSDMALNKVVVWDEKRRTCVTWRTIAMGMDVILAAEYEALGRKMNFEISSSLGD